MNIAVPVPTKPEELNALPQYDGTDVEAIYSDNELAIFWCDPEVHRWWLVERPDGSFCKSQMTIEVADHAIITRHFSRNGCLKTLAETQCSVRMFKFELERTICDKAHATGGSKNGPYARAVTAIGNYSHHLPIIDV